MFCDAMMADPMHTGYSAANSLVPDITPTLAPASPLEMDAGLQFQSRSAGSLAALSTTALPLEQLTNFQDLGSIIPVNGAIGSMQLVDTIGPSNPVDYFRFQSGVNLDIDVSQFGQDVDIQLIRDINQNNLIDPGEILASSSNPDLTPERISLRGLQDEPLFLRVSTRSAIDVSYNLNIVSNNLVATETKDFNNTIGTAEIIEGNLISRRSFTGSLNNTNDRVDFYQFQVDRAISFTAMLGQGVANTNFSLIHDANNNGIVDRGEVLYSSRLPGSDVDVLRAESLTPGNYLIRVEKPIGGEPSTDYQLAIHGVPIAQANFGITIERITALDQFDLRIPFTNRHEADFEPLVNINGIRHSFGIFEDTDDITRRLRVTQQVDVNQRFIPFRIHVNDHDALDFYDPADINPVRGQKYLSLTYDTVTRQITGDGLPTFTEGSLITLQGAGNDGDRARIAFRVNYNPTILSPA